MTATYSGDPTDSSKDAVRFLIGDTSATFEITDEEIAYILTLYPTPLGAAAACCRALASRFAKMVDKEVGDLKIKYSQRQKAFLDLAGQLEQQSGLTGLMPYAGGISVADKETVEADSDRPKPSFRSGQFDHRDGLPQGGETAAEDPLW